MFLNKYEKKNLLFLPNLYIMYIILFICFTIIQCDLNGKIPFTFNYVSTILIGKI